MERNMHNKKILLSVFLVFSLLLSACNLPTLTPDPPTNTVSSAYYTNYLLDCAVLNGGQTNPIQPPANCDRWQDNRYERPFNAERQDIYYPDVDILFSAFGQSGDWFFTRIALNSLRPGGQTLMGSYAVELDTDKDMRGDFLIVGTPQISSDQSWNPNGVQIWYDSNNDVGNHLPGQPDGPYKGDGYDELLLDSGQGKNPGMAFMRVGEKYGHPYLELAFETRLVGDPDSFYWWTWADEGVRQPGSFDYHDAFDLQAAGEVYVRSQYFPAKSIADVDNTCIDSYGTEPPIGDSHFCRGDPAVNYIPPDSGCEDPIIDTVNSSILCPTPTPSSLTSETPTAGTGTPTVTVSTPCPTGSTACETVTATPTCSDLLSSHTQLCGSPSPCMLSAHQGDCTPTPTATHVRITFTPKPSKKPTPRDPGKPPCPVGVAACP
jgi:hypothetical protein